MATSNFRTPCTRAASRRWTIVAVSALVLLVAACADDSGDAATGLSSADAPAATSDGDGGDVAETVDEAAPAEPSPADDEATVAARDAVELDSDAAANALFGGQEQPTTTTPAGPDDPGLAVPADLTSLVVGRDIIYRSAIDMRVDDVAVATGEALRAVQGIGLIFGQESTTDPAPRTVLTIKVRPEDFSRAVAALKSGVGGSVERETVTTDDVTERVVDLEGRITGQEKSVERTRALLDEARDINTIRALEAELIERETTLEILRGQLKTLQDQVALATITLTITQRSQSALVADMGVIAWLGVDADQACPGGSELKIDASASATLCVEVENSGDDVLTDIDIEVPAFNLRVDDLTVREGSLVALDPGQALTAVVELDADDGFIRRRDVRDGVDVGVVVTAVPAGDPEALLEESDAVFVTAVVDEALPGFGDSLQSGWGAFTTVVGLLLIALGVLLPFLPFLALVLWLIRRSQLKALERSYPAGHPDEILEGAPEPEVH